MPRDISDQTPIPPLQLNPGTRLIAHIETFGRRHANSPVIQIRAGVAITLGQPEHMYSALVTATARALASNHLSEVYELAVRINILGDDEPFPTAPTPDLAPA